MKDAIQRCLRKPGPVPNPGPWRNAILIGALVAVAVLAGVAFIANTYLKKSDDPHGQTEVTVASFTATPKPTEISSPTETPIPTETPEPTATSKPTETPEPTATPEPTVTLMPTSTPAPLPAEWSTTLPVAPRVLEDQNGGIILESYLEAPITALADIVPGIVQIYDGFRANNTGYIVMEYLRGCTIKDLVKEGRSYTFEETAKILVPVLDTLDVYLLTGEKPVSSIERIPDDVLKLPSALNGAITHEQEAVILKGMAVRAEDRYQSAKEMKAAILACLPADEIMETLKTEFTEEKTGTENRSEAG